MSQYRHNGRQCGVTIHLYNMLWSTRVTSILIAISVPCVGVFELFSVHLHKHTRDSGPIRDPPQDSFWTGWDSFPCSSSHEPHAQGSSRVNSYTNYWHFYLCESVLALNVSTLATTHPSSVWARVFVKPPPASNWNRSKGVVQVLSGQCPHCRLQAPNFNWMAAFLWAFIWELHQFWSSQDWKPMFMAAVNWFAWTEKETSMAGLILLKSDRSNYGLGWLAAFKRWVLFSFQYQPKAPIPTRSHH